MERPKSRAMHNCILRIQVYEDFQEIRSVLTDGGGGGDHHTLKKHFRSLSLNSGNMFPGGIFLFLNQTRVFKTFRAVVTCLFFCVTETAADGKQSKENTEVLYLPKA